MYEAEYKMSAQESISATKWVGGACGRHGSSIFYKAFQYNKNSASHISSGGEKILGLGEFFFLQFREEDPICIGELQLLWHDKQSDQDLSSSRLYYVPETTPTGRTNLHGQDEVVAFSEKVVMRISLLASCVVQPARWGYGAKCPVLQKNGSIFGAMKISPMQRYALSNPSFQNKDVARERVLIGSNECRPQVRVLVLSFAQFNRHVALLKRVGSVDDCDDVTMAKLSLLGLFTSVHENTRIVFARCTFESNMLAQRKIFHEFTAPVLKGRPRKRNKRTTNSNKKNPVDVTKDESRDLRRRSARLPKPILYPPLDFEQFIGCKPRLSNERRRSAVVANCDKKEAISGTDSNLDVKTNNINNAVSRQVTRKSFRKRTKVSPLPGSVPTDRIDQFLDFVCKDSDSEEIANDAEIQKITSQKLANKRRNSVSPYSLSTASSSTTPRSVSGCSKVSESPDCNDMKETNKMLTSNSRINVIPTDEASFYEILQAYMKNRETPINKIPSLGFKKLDLWAFYKLSQEYGGYDMITTKRLWKHVYDRMGGNPSCTSAATCTRKHYEKLLLPFELHLKCIRRNENVKRSSQQNAKNLNSSNNHQSASRRKESSPTHITNQSNKRPYAPVKMLETTKASINTDPKRHDDTTQNVSLKRTDTYLLHSRHPKNRAKAEDKKGTANQTTTPVSSLPPSKRYRLTYNCSSIITKDTPEDLSCKKKQFSTDLNKSDFSDVEIKSVGIPSPCHTDSAVVRRTKSASPIHGIITQPPSHNLTLAQPPLPSKASFLSGRTRDLPPPYIPKKSFPNLEVRKNISSSSVGKEFATKRRYVDDLSNTTPSKHLKRTPDQLTPRTPQLPPLSCRLLPTLPNIHQQPRDTQYFNDHNRTITTQEALDKSGLQQTPVSSIVRNTHNHSPSALKSDDYMRRMQCDAAMIGGMPFYPFTHSPMMSPYSSNGVALQRFLNMQQTLNMDVSKQLFQQMALNRPRVPPVVPQYNTLLGQQGSSMFLTDTLNAYSEMSANLKRDFVQRLAASNNR